MVRVCWWKNCQQETKEIKTPICDSCGKPAQLNRVCTRCKTSHSHYKAVRDWAEFNGPIRNAKHDLKYQKKIALGAALAKPLVRLFHQYDWPVDLVTPVPFGKER